MLPISTTAPLRLETPAGLNEARPVYLGKVSTLSERALFEAEISAPPWNAGRVYDFQLVDALEESVREKLSEDLAAPLLEIFQRLRADPEGLTDADQAAIAQMEAVEAQLNGTYARLLAARRRRSSLLPLLALKRFLTGWERPEPFVRAHDGGPDDATLELIPEGERLWLGLRLYQAQFVSADEGKSLPSPPTSPPAPATSGVVGGRQTAAQAGKSGAQSTRKTRR